MFNLTFAGRSLPLKSGPEKRDATRRTKATAVKLKLANGTWYDCRTADLSSTGAQIKLGPRPVLLPPKCDVWLSEGTVRPARIVWRTKNAVGIRFL